MRISTQQFFQTSLVNMQRTTAALGKTQEQLSTGVRVQTPSDDPVASAKIGQLQERQSLIDQYQSNIDIAMSLNELSESVLGSITDNLQRVRDLALQANSSTLTNDNRASIATEIRIIVEALQGQFNSNNGLGGYLYSGFQSTQKPFEERSGGGYDYLGDSGANFLQISSSTQVPISDSGKDLFVDIPATNPTITTFSGRGNSENPGGVISIGTIVDPAEFEAVYPDDFVIEFNDPELNQGRSTFTVTRASDGQPVFGTSPVGKMVNVPFRSGRTIEFNGIALALSGAPQTGDRFIVKSSSTANILNMVDRFADVLDLLSMGEVSAENNASLIGRASAPNDNLNSAGNYVAQQTITVTGDDGTVQTYAVSANQSSASIAAGLSALTGVTATAQPTAATLDFSTTDWSENEQISFTLNGTSFSATVGATDAATYANIDAALGPAPAGLTKTNNGDGTWSLVEPGGTDITIEDFAVTDFPLATFGVVGGFNIGDVIAFDLTTSTGASIPVSYVVSASGTGVIDEFRAQLQTDIVTAGAMADFNIAQPGGAGTPITVQYVGDTSGNASFNIVNFSDGGAENAQLQVLVDSGNEVVDAATGDDISIISNVLAGSVYSIQARESRSTMQFSGSRGSAVTLLDGGRDSSAVAAQLTITPAVGYTMTSSVGTLKGGLISSDLGGETPLQSPFQDAVEAFLEDLDSGLDGIVQARSRIGARLNTLENIKFSNEGVLLEITSFMSEVRDVDFAEASSRLNMQTFILQAAQQSFVRISRLNLFQFL